MVIGVFLVGCSPPKESLILGKWAFDKLEIHNKEVGIAEGQFYVFNSDSTYSIETKWEPFGGGMWFLVEDKLSIYDIDTAVYQIEGKTEDELKWLILKQDTVSMYLKQIK